MQKKQKSYYIKKPAFGVKVQGEGGMVGNISIHVSAYPTLPDTKVPKKVFCQYCNTA